MKGGTLPSLFDHSAFVAVHTTLTDYLAWPATDWFVHHVNTRHFITAQPEAGRVRAAVRPILIWETLKNSLSLWERAGVREAST